MRTNNLLVSIMSLSGVLFAVVGVFIFAAYFGQKNLIISGIRLDSDIAFALIIGGLLLYGLSFILGKLLRK